MADATTAGGGLSLLLNALPAFLLVLGAPAMLWWWSRRARHGSPGRLRITDKAALGRSTWVAVVEIDGRRLLVGAGEHGIDLLSELGAGEPAHELAPELGRSADRIAELDNPRNGIASRPRMGLVQRLQLMTLRTSRPVPRPHAQRH